MSFFAPKRSIGLLLVVGVAISISACGSGGGDSPTPPIAVTPPPTFSTPQVAPKSGSYLPDVGRSATALAFVNETRDPLSNSAQRSLMLFSVARGWVVSEPATVPLSSVPMLGGGALLNHYKSASHWVERVLVAGQGVTERNMFAIVDTDAVTQPTNRTSAFFSFSQSYDGETIGAAFVQEGANSRVEIQQSTNMQWPGRADIVSGVGAQSPIPAGAHVLRGKSADIISVVRQQPFVSETTHYYWAKGQSVPRAFVTKTSNAKVPLPYNVIETRLESNGDLTFTRVFEPTFANIGGSTTAQWNRLAQSADELLFERTGDTSSRVIPAIRMDGSKVLFWSGATGSEAHEATSSGALSKVTWQASAAETASCDQTYACTRALSYPDANAVATLRYDAGASRATLYVSRKQNDGSWKAIASLDLANLIESPTVLDSISLSGVRLIEGQHHIHGSVRRGAESRPFAVVLSQ
jgi:hypothetical protein